MEAARKRDEAGERSASLRVDSEPAAGVLAEAAGLSASSAPLEMGDPGKPQIEELLICSVQGDVLYQWQCRDWGKRIGFLEFLSQKARQLAKGLPLGDFDRLEAQDGQARVIARIQADRAVLVRSSRSVSGAG